MSISAADVARWKRVKRPGRPPAADPAETISVRLPRSQADALYCLALRRKISLSELLRPWLVRLLETAEAQEAGP